MSNMKEQDFYVVLRKGDVEQAGITKPEDEIAIVLPLTFTSVIDDAFNLCHKDWTFSIAKETTEFCFSVLGNDVDINLEVLLNGELDHLCISANSNNRKTCIEALEHLQNKLSIGVDGSQEFILIKSYDAVSAYYCEKISKKLSKFERLLRRLLINVYTAAYGVEYYDQLSPQDNINNAKRLIKHKNSNKREQYSQKILYSLTFDDIDKILFTPNWNDDDIARKNEFLEANENLSDLSDDELREFIIGTEPKSDWKRFFENKVNYKEMQASLNTIKKFRNTISHNKFFYKDDYERCNKLLNELNKVISSAIKLTEEKQFIENYFDMLSGLSSRIENTLNGLVEKMQKSLERTMQAYVDSLEKILSYEYDGEIEPETNEVATP